MLWSALGYNLYFYWSPVNSYTSWHMSFWPHWDMGGIFVIEMLTIILGIVLMFVYRVDRPPVLPRGGPQRGHADARPRQRRPRARSLRHRRVAARSLTASRPPRLTARRPRGETRARKAPLSWLRPARTCRRRATSWRAGSKAGGRLTPFGVA